MRGLLLAALTEAALITWRDLSKTKVIPLPSDYAAVAILYGGLGLLPESASGVASLVGWGIVLATFLNLPGAQLVYPGAASQTSGGTAPSSSSGGTATSNAALNAGGAAGGLTASLGANGPQYGTPNPTGGVYPVKAQ